MTAHTPGPWTTSKLGNPYDQFAIYADDQSNALVCNSVEGESNADLIAAAPDLLAACHAVEEAQRGGDYGQAFDMVRAAIAKADGRES